MSRANVRDSLAATLSSVDGLKTVFPRAPKVIAASERPAAVVHLERVRERREANQAKIRTYAVKLGVDFASSKRKSEDAQVDFDALLDSIEDQLRANKNLGTVVLRAAEPDMQTTHTFPVTDKAGKTFISAVLEFEVDELVQGA